ncbi:complex I NDUFA9 subunit family protein [Lichenihabitans sp. PAMC28606]|uniref:complex I NDUFA9 subunit family protein n=1 Tax=Lichenihabitans sp. PAMC28606 TaxID=2880932 RepID=UPI001D0B603B|nr:complex I NDUFA9 subunit family protein [Lichenihabitans sp. PAMC28606]UDL94089.1 complex I NDUFA9 subunit family protein [Lichenihabitans sp. PAMC28606]
MAGVDIAHDRIVTVFGGSGFLGRHVVRALARDGWRIRIASRRPDLAIHTQTTGRVGQITAVQANLRYPASLAAALRGADAVINLVGILAEQGKQQFETVHTAGAAAVVKAARDAGIGTLVHVSAIGADPEGASQYARSKGKAEAIVREAYPDAVILRPSIVFGPEDEFFNRFAAMARISPVLPLVGGGLTRFQPVYVGDVAEAVAAAAIGTARASGTYELGGPAVRTFKDLMDYVCRVTGRKRLLVPIPFDAMRIPAGLTELADSLLLGAFPKMLLMTRDQITLLRSDNVVSPSAIANDLTLKGLGIEPRAMESIVPSYLYRFRKTGQFDRGRMAP